MECGNARCTCWISHRAAQRQGVPGGAICGRPGGARGRCEPQAELLRSGSRHLFERSTQCAASRAAWRPRAASPAKRLGAAQRSPAATHHEPPAGPLRPTPPNESPGTAPNRRALAQPRPLPTCTRPISWTPSASAVHNLLDGPGPRRPPIGAGATTPRPTNRSSNLDKGSQVFKSAVSAAIPGQRGFDYLIVGAGFAGSVLAERLASALASGCWSSTGAPTSAATPTTTTTRRASSSTATGRTSSTPTRREVFDYLSRFTEWRPYEHRVLASVRRAAAADPDQPRHGQPAVRAAARPSVELEAFFAVRGRAACSRSRTSRGRRRQQGRARAVREVLPRLHPQAVGPRPVRARRLGDRAHPGPHQPRRPLLHRHATRPCRCTATRGCSRGCSTTRTSRSCSTPTTATWPTCVRTAHGLHRARSTSTSTTASASCPTARCSFEHETLEQDAVPAGRDGELPERARLHPHHRVQAPHRPGAPEDDASSTSTRGPRAIPTTRSRARRTPSSTKRYQALAPSHAERALRRPPGDLQVLQHGPGGRPGAGHLEAAAGTARGGRNHRRAGVGAA